LKLRRIFEGGKILEARGEGCQEKMDKKGRKKEKRSCIEIEIRENVSAETSKKILDKKEEILKVLREEG